MTATPTRRSNEPSRNQPDRHAEWSHDWQPRWSHESGRKPPTTVPSSWQATRSDSLAPSTAPSKTSSPPRTGTPGTEPRETGFRTESLATCCGKPKEDPTHQCPSPQVGVGCAQQRPCATPTRWCRCRRSPARPWPSVARVDVGVGLGDSGANERCRSSRRPTLAIPHCKHHMVLVHGLSVLPRWQVTA